MTPQDDAAPQIYVPALHRELVPYGLPATVLFLDPGLLGTATAHGLYHPRTYPFAPAEAARVLDELLAVGEALDVSGTTGSQAARAFPAGTQPLSDREEADIERFARGAARPGDAADERAARIAAHKVLLLAWDLESRRLEIDALRREVAEAVKPLADNLHGDCADDAVLRDIARTMPGVLPESLADLPEIAEPDWRLTLSAAFAFAPENAVFVTAHAGMRAAMLEAGMLHPLPEDVAQTLDGWREEDRSRLLWAQTPLWRLLGHSREPENAPWLRAAPEIVVCPVKGCPAG